MKLSTILIINLLCILSNIPFVFVSPVGGLNLMAIGIIIGISICEIIDHVQR